MRRSATLGKLVASVASALALAAVAVAQTGEVSARLDAELISAVRLKDGEGRFGLAVLKPAWRWRKGSDWRADLALRLELAGQGTDLGTTATASDLSRPLLHSDDARLEIDRATLNWRGEAVDLTLGKQTVAWGVLDGLQVTDRFDAVRRRESIFTDPRPERLSRWGARLKLTRQDTELDLAAMFDPTVNQLPGAQGDFAPLATRFRGGAPSGLPTPPLRISDRNAILEDATIGARLTHTLSSAALSLVAISGPDPEPVFTLASRAGSPEIRFDYPRRTLLGATAERSAGAQVWRAEFAVIPDQVVNTMTRTPFSSTQRTRVLAGVGLDWSAPHDVFVNAQLGIDHVSGGDEPLVRPPTDVVATLRLQKSLMNERVWLRGEVISVLSDGDGTLRPWVDWRLSDNATVSLGADLIWGSREGLIGQFRDQSRGWVRLKWSI